ncbi:MAG: YARHG domain-containing protein [Roseibium sp.]|uniref:YARHG domain-containing protein n=1 Tax=Roseibium sp. TaxID=1936156 RepID=UPI001B08D55A|nr:YARHG domain-containing protein [Roseibium sp.]MBO6509001.1 YARHG domain-containing protein [Roseibium sp.]MBO6890726.1 YARHG domain-containing protein [Roseibium sp.]MBO6930985.1 YARHG domain-containing protein [Roseibium sp.]
MREHSKLFIVLLAFCSLCGAASAQSYSVFPNSSNRSLYDNELSVLTCQDLWVARNEIYDRRGYCFKTRRGQAFFSNQGCWTNAAQLSRLENQNVARIKAWERRFGC